MSDGKCEVCGEVFPGEPDVFGHGDIGVCIEILHAKIERLEGENTGLRRTALQQRNEIEQLKADNKQLLEEVSGQHAAIEAADTEIERMTALAADVLEQYVMDEGETWPSDCIVDDLRDACGLNTAKGSEEVSDE